MPCIVYKIEKLSCGISKVLYCWENFLDIQLMHVSIYIFAVGAPDI